jgi:hypothetical protein
MKNLNFLVGTIVFVLGICFVSCASNPSFTVRVANDMELLNITESFRFFVSTNVELKRMESETGSANKDTIVKQRILNEVIRLKKNTTGRARSFDGESIDIQFEPADKNGVYRTIRFALKSVTPNDNDLFYFYYERDAERTETIEEGVIRRTVVQGNLIKYGKDRNGKDILYEVTYEGKNEPFLLYKEDVKEKTRKRTLRGVR